MDTSYTILRPGQDPESGAADLAAEPTYDELLKLLGPIIGGDLEHVWIMLPSGRPGCMFVDERGHLKGLPFNRVATEHYQRAAKLRGDKGPLSTIVGPAVVFDRRVWF